MKIAIINSVYWPNINGGSQISTRILAECLSKKGHIVYVITQSDKDEIIVKDSYTIYYVKLYKTSFIETLEWSKARKFVWMMNDLYDVKSANKISSIINEIAPNIVHTNCIQGFSCVLWRQIKKLNIPIIHTLRDYYLVCARSLQRYGCSCNGKCLLCRMFNLSKKQYSNYVDGVVGVSSFILNIHLQNGYFKNAICKSIIPNPFLTVEKKKNVSYKNIRFGFIGRIVKAKGLELALDSFLRVKDSCAHFYVAGNGSKTYMTYLKSRYKDPRITFMGYQKSNVFFQNIDILIIPSLWPEPFGRVAIEAAAHNIYLLVANSGGLIDIVKDLKYGCIFNKKDKDDLYEKMKWIIKNKKYDERINVSNLNRYSPDNIAELYIHFYNEVIGG